MSKHISYSCNGGCKKTTQSLSEWLVIEAVEGSLKIVNNVSGRKLMKLENHESIHFCSVNCFTTYFFYDSHL